AAIVAGLASGLGEAAAAVAPPVVTPRSTTAADRREPRPAFASGDALVGVPASRGVAIGRIVQLRRSEVGVAEHADSPGDERARLASALADAKRQLEEMRLRLRGEADYGKAAIFGAQEEILADPELLDAAARGIAAGQSAAFAWRAAAAAHAALLAGLENELLAARATDVRDVGRRVLNGLIGDSDARDY